jgi:hypothetical protein
MPALFVSFIEIVQGFPPATWLLMEAGLVFAYVVFGISGFGSALLAAPLLSGVLPLSRIVPILVLLDFTASFGNWMPDRRSVARDELRRLLPFLLVGAAAGVWLLLHLQPRVLLLLMGLFVTAYALYSLSGLRPPSDAQASPRWALPSGLVGGLFGALFGSGGFLYALYLAARLDSKEQIRATQSALIGCSALIRLGLYLVAGVYAQGELLVLALCLAPAMMLGVWIGRRLVLRLSREHFVRLVTWIVLASGLTLIGRYCFG